MNKFTKSAMVLGVAGAMALGAMSSSEARVRPWVAGAAGFAVGSMIGAAAANSAYYGPGYNDYAYAPGYRYAPAYRSYDYSPGYDAYGYAPGYGSNDGYTTNYGYSSTSRPAWQERMLEGYD